MDRNRRDNERIPLLEPPEETIAKLEAKVGQVIEEQVGIEEERAGYFAELVGIPVGSSWSDIEGAIRKLIEDRDAWRRRALTDSL